MHSLGYPNLPQAEYHLTPLLRYWYFLLNYNLRSKTTKTVLNPVTSINDYGIQNIFTHKIKIKVNLEGFEPSTFPLSTERSNH